MRVGPRAAFDQRLGNPHPSIRPAQTKCLRTEGGKLAVDHYPQRRQMVYERIPHPSRRHVLVFVAVEIACRRHLPPFNRGVTGLQFVGQAPLGLGDDFEATGHGI